MFARNQLDILIRPAAPALLFAFLVFGCSVSGPQLSDKGDSLLLDGIASWVRVGSVTWSLADGELRAAPESGEGFIVLPGEFGNFTLQLEFWIAPGTNSGVFIRCQDLQEITPWTCYEVNLWDRHTNQAHRTGSIVAIAEPLTIVNTENRWSTLEITAAGPRLRVVINDIVTADVLNDQMSAGFIALQAFGDADVRFRDLRLRSVETPPG